jgi:RHS repeat-associated protein
MSQKQYELTNHLGNVLSTVLDRKTPITATGGSGSSTTITHYEGDVVFATDYYPFGSPMSWSTPDSSGGRMYSGVGYRYGFNGKEKDTEISGDGNMLDFGARIYNSRLGRWTSTDLFFSLQPDQSVYKAFLNNPILLTDPDGNTEIITTILVNKMLGITIIKQSKSDRVMTDGLKTRIDQRPLFGGPVTSWYFVNYYYDFRTINYKIIEKDGSQRMITESRIIKNSKAKLSGLVIIDGAKSGETKNESWLGNDWDIGGFIMYGSETKSGHSISNKTRKKLWGSFSIAEFNEATGLIINSVSNKNENLLSSDFSVEKFSELAMEIGEYYKNEMEQPSNTEQDKINPKNGKVIHCLNCGFNYLNGKTTELKAQDTGDLYKAHSNN